MKKSIFYSSIGGILEFYDFIIFAIFATAISNTFFPAESQVAGLLLTFSIFAAGYLVRPIGGIIFGHFGDKYGRKKTFTYSIIMMASATFLIAFLPSYGRIGILAPIFLTILRLIQGASIGGEIPGAITFISETTSKSRTLACSIIFFGLVLGIILGELVNIGLTKWLPAPDMLAYGWRIAFILGGIFGMVGFFLRRELVETPLFKDIEHSKTKAPFLTVIKKYPMEIFSGWALMGLVSAGIMVLFLMMPAYSKVAGIPAVNVLLINTFILFVVMGLSLIFGFLGDRINKRYLLLISPVVIMIFSYMVFQHLTHHDISLITYALFCLFTMGIAVALVPCILAESFPTQIRYTGVGIVYNLSFATTGGLAPVIIFYLISRTDNILMPVVYLMGVSVIALVGIALYPKNHFDASIT
ncbi:MAG: MHS family MFS transporter [Desulfobacteraceae bacterium]|nr:MHS family MFS transporter [Desulfobacteraceae bacterium]